MKYKITDEFMPLGKRKFFRIVALNDFSDVKCGENGGLVEFEHNLSQDGDCWIYDNAKAIDGSTVSDKAQIRDNSEVSGTAKVCGDAVLNGKSYVGCRAVVASGTLKDCVVSK